MFNDESISARASTVRALFDTSTSLQERSHLHPVGSPEREELEQEDSAAISLMFKTVDSIENGEAHDLPDAAAQAECLFNNLHNIVQGTPMDDDLRSQLVVTRNMAASILGALGRCITGDPARALSVFWWSDIRNVHPVLFPASPIHR